MIPPSLNPVVQLTRVKQDPDPVSSSPYTIVTRAIKIPRGITDAKTYLALASSSTIITKTTPSTTNTIQTPRSSTLSKDTKTYKKKLYSCQRKEQTIQENQWLYTSHYNTGSGY